jgi:hypothetical protein
MGSRRLLGRRVRNQAARPGASGLGHDAISWKCVMIQDADSQTVGDVRFPPIATAFVQSQQMTRWANCGSSCHTKYASFSSVSNAKAPTAPILGTKAQSPIELQIGLFTRTISDIGAIRVSATTGSLSASSKLAHGSTNCSIASPAEVIISTH